MKFKDKLLIFISLLIAGPIESLEYVSYAAIIFRHGDRTPVGQFPTDPYKNESLWPVKFGELTNTGKQQHFALGQWLRSRYNHLLSAKFDPTEIYIRSSDVDRTLMSAMVNLAGMYPPMADSIWNPLLKWQPIPVHTVPEKEDNIISMARDCPNFTKEKIRLKNSLPYKDRLKKYNSLMGYLTKYTGKKVVDYQDIQDIYSVLKIEQLYNFTLPGWTTAVFPEKMAEPAGYSFRVETLTPLMARLKIGPFLKEVVNNMYNVMRHHNSQLPHHNPHYEDWDGETPRKLNIYSAHDLNIGSILNGLGLYDGRCPEYTSTILFELVYDEEEAMHFVKIFYRNTTEIKEPILLNIPTCGTRCPLEQFMTLYDKLIPLHWENECAIKFPTALLVTMIICLLFYVCSYICYYNPCYRTPPCRNNVQYSGVFSNCEVQKAEAV